MVIGDVQNPDPTAVGQLVTHEIQRPSLHGGLGNQRCHPVPPRQLSTLFHTHLQAFGRVEPIGPFVVHDQALAAKHGVQPQIAIAPVLRGQCLHPLDHSLVVLRHCPILLNQPRQANNPAGPSFTEPTLGHQEAHGFALRHGLHQFFASRSFIADMSSIWSACAMVTRTNGVLTAHSASAWRSRPPTHEASWPPTLPCRHTSCAKCRTWPS